MERLALFDDLAKVYKDHGYRLYLVGGSVRDLLLGRPIEDYDFATDATPEEETFLEGADFSFARFGSVYLRDKKAEVTTLRVEGPYKDHRHPSYVKFVKDPLEDYKRRDFTVNAMYLDSDYRLRPQGSAPPLHRRSDQADQGGSPEDNQGLPLRPKPRVYHRTGLPEGHRK